MVQIPLRDNDNPFWMIACRYVPDADIFLKFFLFNLFNRDVIVTAIKIVTDWTVDVQYSWRSLRFYKVDTDTNTKRTTMMVKKITIFLVYTADFCMQ